MVEGGLLQHHLTKGTIKEIRTHNEVFRSGDNILPFVLQAAMSTQYSLDLSEHVRRGIDSKVQSGGYPQRAPEGYVNNLFEHTIEEDPERFLLIRQAWDLMLTGSYSLERLADKMNAEWGYITRKARKIGGSPMSTSCLHRIFNNLFYTGFFLRKGELIQGQHPAMITFPEFDAVQKILRRSGNIRPQHREFPYTGMVVCGNCGRPITAEHQKGRHRNGDYTYYHCPDNHRCQTGFVRQEKLEEEIECYLSSVAVDPGFRDLCIQVIDRMYTEASNEEHSQYEQQNRSLEDVQQQMSRLIKLSLKGMIIEEEFECEKSELQEKLNALKKETVRTENRLEEARANALEVAEFVTSAPYIFRDGNIQEKREIAKKLGVVYKIAGGKLELELHPLLVPLYNRPLEPLITGSESKKDGSYEPSVPLGWGEGTTFETFRCVWDLLMNGTASLGMN
jgi:site-specific DNA recombinase